MLDDPLPGKPEVLRRHGSPWSRQPPPLPLLPLPLLLLAVPWPVKAAAPAEEARLERGEILAILQELPGEKAARCEVRGVVDAPPAAVWEVIDRCGEYESFMPRVEASEEIERQGERVVCRIVIDMPFPFGSLWTVNEAEHLSLPGIRFERRYRMREGNYKVNKGVWEVAPWGEGGRRSLVTYRSIALPDLILPDGLMASLQQRGARDLFLALRRRVAQRLKAAAAPATAVQGAQGTAGETAAGGAGSR